jgi:cytoskeleton protein RodZ
MPDQVDWRAIEREAAPGRAVGRLLRDQREARGLSLSEVEKSLRIRRAHIEAIEEGRFDKLPGAAYIPAFLRAYAAHVDLDPEKVMTAYHLSGPVPIKRPVALPADFPIVEKRAPIGLAVLTVLLVVGAGYAVWNYMPREQTVVAEKVPPVPDRLLAARPSEKEASSVAASASSAPASTTPATPAQETRTVTGTLPADVWPAHRPAPAPAASAGGMAPAVVSAPAAPTSGPATSGAATSIPAAPALTPPPVVVAVPAPPPQIVMTVPAIGQAQAAQPPAPVDPRAALPGQAAAGQPLPGQPPVEEANARPPADAAPPAPAPVRVNTPISVRTNSWVELRGPNGDVLTQTYVRAGESYVVPAGIAYRITEAR